MTLPVNLLLYKTTHNQSKGKEERKNEGEDFVLSLVCSEVKLPWVPGFS